MDVTDLIVEAVEEDVGIDSSAWDTIDPKEIIRAVCKVVGLEYDRLLRNSQRRAVNLHKLAEALVYIVDEEDVRTDDPKEPFASGIILARKIMEKRKNI